jgi:hypothetical protein
MFRNSTITFTLRVIGAILLSVALALPVSRTSTFFIDLARKIAAMGVPIEEVEQVAKRHDFALESYDITEAEWWITAAAFLWPWMLILLLRTIKTRAVQHLLLLPEFLLLCLSWVVVALTTFLEEPFIGYYVGMFGVVVYGIAWIGSVTSLARSALRRIVAQQAP